MFRSFRIGTLLGFPIEVNLTFLLMLGAVLLFMGGLAGLALVSVAFASVLLHELGHAVVARRRGVDVAGIELHFFGGAAKMINQPRTARDEVAIAAAGPAVSFVLAALGLALGSLTGIYLLELVGWINLVIATFNLVPALPMDGGRIFRALLSGKLGFLRATEVSVTVARVFAVGLGVFALATTQIYLLLLVVVLWTMGSAELAYARHMPFYPGEAATWTPQFPDVEVLPRGFHAWNDETPPSQRREPRSRRPGSGGGFVIRRVNGRVFVEFVAPRS